MTEKTYLTDCQRKRFTRNTEIIDRFKASQGAISAIVKDLSNDYGLSEANIRYILRAANCIGWKKD